MSRWFSLFLVLSIWFIPSFAKRVFGGFDFQQIVFFGVMPGATDGTDWEVYFLFFKWVVVRPLILTVIIYCLYRLLKLLFGAKWRERKKLNWAIIAVLGVFGVDEVLRSVGYYTYLKRAYSEDETAQYFKAVSDIDLAAKSSKNLILIYVESLENTYSEPKFFGTNLNEPIENLLGKSGYRMQQVSGTHWSIAGQVASQCGIPLATFLGNAVGAYTDKMLGNITCLGDILNAAGYHQTFLVGSNVKHSGLSSFYSTHGYDEVLGKYELESHHAEQERTGWGEGLQDDTLMDVALDIALKQSKSDQPFNITVELTDNHAANGILSPRCRNKGLGEQLYEVIYCTNETLAKFINALDNARILDDTVLVILGDHLFMGDFDKNLDGFERSIYFNYLAHDKFNSKKSGKISHFDVYPTLLSLVAGYNLPTLHLGINLSTPDSNEKQRMHDYVFGPEYNPNAPFFKKFWDVE